MIKLINYNGFIINILIKIKNIDFKMCFFFIKGYIFFNISYSMIFLFLNFNINNINIICWYISMI